MARVEKKGRTVGELHEAIAWLTGYDEAQLQEHLRSGTTFADLHPLLDQKMVGAAVERAGAARLLTKSAKPKHLAAAVGQLLGDGTHRAAAARLGVQIRATSAAARAGDVLESAINRGLAVASGS